MSANQQENKFPSPDNAPATSIVPDLERFELRRFLQALSPGEFEVKTGATRLSAVAAVL